MNAHPERLWQNLVLLGFPHTHSYETFMCRSVDPKLADQLIHFVFTKISSKEAHMRFKACWPVLEHIGNKDFRLAALKWATDLKTAGLTFPDDLVLRRSFFDDGHGDKFVMIMMWLSVLALRRQVDLENYASIKYPAATFLPYACAVPETKEELVRQYIPTQKETFAKIWTAFAGKRAKAVAIESCLNCEKNDVFNSGESDLLPAALKFLQHLKEINEKNPIIDERAKLQQALTDACTARKLAAEENHRLRSVIIQNVSAIPIKKSTKIRHEEMALTVNIDQLLSPELLKTKDEQQPAVPFNSILDSEVDTDAFLVR